MLNSNFDSRLTLALSAVAALFATTSSALAGTPAPLAGAFGPVGLVVAGAGYGGYRLVKYVRNSR